MKYIHCTVEKLYLANGGKETMCKAEIAVGKRKSSLPLLLLPTLQEPSDGE